MEHLDFATELKHSILMLDAWDKAELPRQNSRRERPLKIFKDDDPAPSTEVIRTRLSEWRRGFPEAFKSSNGLRRVINLSDLIAERNSRQASRLLSSYSILLSEAGSQRLQTALDALPSIKTKTLLCNLLTQPQGWIQFALILHLMNHKGQWPEVMLRGWRGWEMAREGYDVPECAFYSVRRVLFEAKEHGIARGKCSELVERFGNHVPLCSPAPNFTHFRKLATQTRTWTSPGRDFTEVSVGIEKRKTIFYSQQINERLFADEADAVEIERDDELYALPPQCELFCWLALNAALCTAGNDIFNGFKVRPVEPLSLDTFKQGSIELQRTTYLASQVTNWSDGLAFENLRTQEVVRLQSENGEPLPPSAMSGHFGVMSLVVTADHYLVAMFQDPVNARGGDELVPFGGSVEFYDLDKWGASLGAYLRASMAREVMEESAIDQDSIGLVKLLGHTLDAGKGLKPDFFGITFIEEPWEQIKMNREELYGGALEARKVDFGSTGAFLSTLDALEEAWQPLTTAAFLHANLLFIRHFADEIVNLKM